MFTNENINTMPNFETKHQGEPLDNIIITQETVKKALEKLKPGKSQGPDGLHPKILKETTTQHN